MYNVKEGKCPGLQKDGKGIVRGGKKTGGDLFEVAKKTRREMSGRGIVRNSIVHTWPQLFKVNILLNAIHKFSFALSVDYLHCTFYKLQ